MIYVHSMGRAVRYYPHQPALILSDESRVTFTQLHDRVKRLAAALVANGFALEKRVGAELFIRHPKGIALSPAGSAFLHKARLAVREADGAIQDALDAKNGVSGHVKIFCSPLAEYTLLKDVLRMMRQSCPALVTEVQFSSGTNHLSSVADGTFSASFMSCHSALSNPVLLCETLYHEECVVMLPESHPLARSRSLSLHQLAQETWIVTELSDAILQNSPFSSGCDAAGFDPKSIRPAEWHSLFPLVASGAGISLVPAALQSIRRPDLRFVPLADGLQIPVNVITRANDPSPHVLQFRQCAAQAFAMCPGSSITKVPRFPARRATSSRKHAGAVRIPRRVGVRISSSVT